MPEYSPHELEALRLKAAYDKMAEEERRADAYFELSYQQTPKDNRDYHKKTARKPRPTPPHPAANDFGRDLPA